MPVSLPGFGSYNAFFDLFLPLKTTQHDSSFNSSTIDFDESWFTSPEKTIPLTEDCLRAVKQMLGQCADFAQRKYLLRTLLQYFPGLPADIINAAHSLYMAIVRKENIDLAVLNTLGLASCHLLPDGNAVSQLALFVRETLISWLGEGYIKQFLESGEDNLDNTPYISLVIIAITLKYWLRNTDSPQRRYLQIPPFLANLVLRLSNYWDQLGQMSQHATEHCLMPVTNTGKNYLCAREDIKGSRPQGLVIQERNAWACAETAEDAISRWKAVPQCDFSLSATTLQKVSEEGVVASRGNPGQDDQAFFQDEQIPEPLTASSASIKYHPVTALMVPVAAGLGMKRAGQAVLGTSLAAAMGYAWYSMFGQKRIPEVTQEQSDLTGILTDNEREVLERLSSRLSHPEPEVYNLNPPAQAFSREEIDELLHMLTDLSDEESDLPVTLPQFAPRAKRAVASNATEPAVTLTLEPQWRKDYWTQRDLTVAKDSPEKPILAVLIKGPQPFKNYSLAAPRESFPLEDAWFTRMDLLDFGNYSTALQDKLLTISTDLSRDKNIKPPAGLLVSKWLHLGKYYEKFYIKLINNWARSLLHKDAEQSAEYAVAARNIDGMLHTINRDWKNKAVSKKKMTALCKHSEKLHLRHAKLVKFITQEKERIADELKHQKWTFGRNVSINEFIWTDYRLSYLDKIDLSKFTFEYLDIIKEFIRANVAWWSQDSETVDLVDVYTGMSILAVGRLQDGLNKDDLKKAYNYAMLDEQLVQIINENIVKLWNEEDQDEYLEVYNPIKSELLPKWLETKQRLEISGAREVTEAPKPTTTEIPLETALTQIDWQAFRNTTAASPELPTERFSATGEIQNRFKRALDETVKTMIDIASDEILNPKQYVASWIAETLRVNGQEGKYTSQSRFAVEADVHPNENDCDTYSYSCKGAPDPAHTIDEIVRGVHRTYDRKNRMERHIVWPAEFSTHLRERLEKGISGDIDRRIDKLFDDNKKSLQDIYRVMIRRAALSYLARKNAVETTEFYHNLFANAAAMYLKGKIDAQLVHWHGSIISGLIFIPAEQSASGDINKFKCGVFLSIWNNEYYEVPWPGLAQTQRDAKVTAKYRSHLVIEGKEDFQNFIEKHRTLRITRKLAKIKNHFDFRTYDTSIALPIGQIFKKGFSAPFTFSTLSSQQLTDKLISLYRQDINDLYDDEIFSAAEFDRAVWHDRINALAIVTGVLLMGAGIAFGGPAWVWVVASMSATIFADVVPHAILASQADSEEEREIYLEAMVMAIAFEVGGTIVSEATAPLIKAAVTRFIRLSSTTFRTTMPRWYQFTKNRLENILSKTAARKLIKPLSETAILSKEAKHDLDSLISAFNPPPGTNGVSKPLKVAGESIELFSIGLEYTLELQEHMREIAAQMEQLFFKPHYRVVTRWRHAEYNYIQNSYFLVGEREADRVVITIAKDRNHYSHFYMSEDDWIRSIIKDGERNNHLLSYYDFARPESLFTEYKDLSVHISSIEPEDYPKAGRHIFVPEAWKERISAFGLKYEDMQRMFDEMRLYEEESLAKTIRQTIEASPELKGELQKISQKVPATVVDSTEAKDNEIMRRAQTLFSIGPDIEKFYPLPKIFPLMDAPEEYAKRWHWLVTQHIETSQGFTRLADNFAMLKRAGGVGGVTLQQIIRIENQFKKTYQIVEKFAVLMKKAKQDPKLREGILVMLARFVNSTDPRVLGEAYQRLDVLAERLFLIAHYHVMDQLLTRIIPTTSTFEGGPLAFVISQDPSARIIINIPRLAQKPNIPEVLMHEMTHLAVRSEDFRYLQNGRGTLWGFPEHHEKFGQEVLANTSPWAVLGHRQQFIESRAPADYKPLSEYDRALAQARVRYLPMLGAYAIMQNADSQVILINALVNSHEFSHTIHGVSEMIDLDAWKVTQGPTAGTSKQKRSIEPEEDPLYHQFREDVLATMINQALSFTKADILSDERLAELELMGTVEPT